MKNAIIDAVSAAPGWIAIYMQQMPSGEIRLVPMHVALWVRVERAPDDQEGEEGKHKRKSSKMLQEYRPHIAGRDGRIIDYRALENERVTYLIMASPSEEWLIVGNEAYAQLMPLATEEATSDVPLEEATKPPQDEASSPADPN